jgi:PAS domain S-box-containing protein
MSFGRRLLLAQIPFAAALLAVGLVALTSLSSIGGAARSLLRDNYRSALAAQRMASALDALDRDAQLWACGQVPGPEGSAAAREQFEAELRVESGNITEPGEAAAAQRLGAAWERYLRTPGAPGTAAPPSPATARSLADAADAVRSAASEIVSINQSGMIRRSDQARLNARDLALFTVFATLVALAVGFVASAAVTATVARPVSALTSAVRAFGEGRLDARVRPQGTDEVAALGREFDTMADRLEQYQKSTLGELLRAHQAVQAAIDALPDPVLVLDPAGAVLNLNRAAERLLGLEPDQGLDAPLPLLDSALRDRIELVRAHVLSGKGPYVPHGFEDAVRVDRPDGPLRVLPRATALLSPERAVIGVAIVLQDVTRLVRIDELRSDLVATVAHEFRTPLTSLQLAVHLLGDGAAGSVTEEQADLVATARDDCRRLQAIVDDILDLSKIRSGRIAIRARPVDAQALLAREVVAAEGPAHAKGVGLDLDLERSTDEISVLADAERVAVALANLFANAVRHTPPGGHIHARLSREGPSVRFEVQDTGPGIPAEHHALIFERFYQVPESVAGGLGLGLYISREIIEAHGGAMGVESSESQGSTFWFTLQAAPGTKATSG